MRDGDKKQWDADFHKIGAGMRDQDPPAPPPCPPPRPPDPPSIAQGWQNMTAKRFLLNAFAHFFR